MNLREPKKKKRVRSESEPPLPISFDENDDWRVFTAHLSACGTCVVDPAEMHAIYSMGFFGKGSLSRSFPVFGRRRFGAPPIITNRQWTRRQQWLEELEKLNADANQESLEMDTQNGADRDSSSELVEESSGRRVVQAETSGTSAALEKAGENEKCSSSGTGSRASESCIKGESKNIEKMLDEGAEIIEEKNCSIEIIEDENSWNFNSKASKKATTRKDDELRESISIQSNNGSKTALVDLEANSCIEFIGREHAVKKAKISDNGAGNSGTRNNETSSTPEPMNVEEVLLDSTEEEEICEIVEKDRNAAGSSRFPDDRILSDEISTEKSQGPAENGEELRPEEETNSYELLVIPDTDSDTENYLSKVKPRIERDGFPVNETLLLTFEETFFLMYGIGCLQLRHYDGSIFSICHAWDYLQQQDKYFIQKYVVYHYFRSKGWVVKPGMKFGGDFLLYKDGPPFYHASYIVVIEVMDADTLRRDERKSLRKITWKNLIGLERLSETIAKEILFAQILWPSTFLPNSKTIPIEALSDFTVRELLWRRWNPKKKQDNGTVEEDSDST